MMELLKVELNNNHEPVVSARTLHKELGLTSRFSLWVEQNFKMFVEDEDFTSVSTNTVVNNGAVRELQDYLVKLDMAKHLAMVSRTEKGKEVRQYFIQVEKEFNSPEKVMARALLMANTQLKALEVQIEEQKPKVIFADAVNASHTSILVGALAKLIKQNGVDMGAKRLFEWLRTNGYLIKKGNDKNMPTQKAMEQKLFEIKERTVNNPDGSIRVTRTPMVTGKGQVFFINKFLGVD